MRIIEKSVSLENAEMIFEIIADVLAKNINTQVFVSNEIMKELEKNGGKHHVFHLNCSKCGHYSYSDDCYLNSGEQWYNFTKGDAFDETIALCSFISNNNEYKQLVQFKRLNYTHYLIGFEQLLLIWANSNK